MTRETPPDLDAAADAFDPLDAFIRRGPDPTDGDALRPKRTSTLPPGDRRLVREVIRSAIIDAQRAKDTRQRRNARAWLQDAAAMLSARACFEELGIDYDAAIEALSRQWAAGVKVKMTHESSRGSGVR